MVLVQVLALIFIALGQCFGGDVITSMDLIGKDCKVTEPIYNNVFDLNALHSDLTHKVPGNKNEFIEFNVCGPMVKLCAGKSQVGACYNKGGKQYILGLEEDIRLTEGRLHFNMTGDQCDKDNKYKLIILLACEYSFVDDPITIMPYSDTTCTFHIIWKTPSACLSLPKTLNDNACTVADNTTGHIFNLMPLSSYNHRIPDRFGSTFIINICKPTLYGHDEMCPPGSSICKANNTDTNLRTKFINYGSTAANPVYENGKLIMHLESTEKCNDTRNFTSHIQFICDSSLLGEPEYLSTRGCEVHFVWQTSLACNTIKSCITVNPISGFTYDLTSLAQKQHIVTRDNLTYAFGICNMVPGVCPDKVGACQTDSAKSIPMGIFNDYLLFNMSGAPYLVYKSGAVCKGISTLWTTRIEFLCDPEGTSEGPIIIENAHCELVIHYMTKLVCQKAISCKAHNSFTNSAVDLTPLISSTKNYLALVNDTLRSTEGPPILYYLNVCRPLVPQFGLSCPGGSAACRAKNTSTTPYQEQGLGYSDVSLTMINKAKAQLQYLRGSACPDDPSVELSSVIDFYCDENAGRGGPILQEILHGCQYKFDWPTNIMCLEHMIEFREKSCEIYNNATNVTLDLKTIEKGLFSIQHQPKAFDVNICGNNRSVEVQYAQGAVNIFFDAKGPCKSTDDPINIELRLVCKDSESHFSSSDIDSCGFVVIKETPLICPIIGITLPNNGKPDTSSQAAAVAAAGDNNEQNSNNNNSNIDSNETKIITGGLSALGAILISSMVLGSFVLIVVIIFKNPERREKCVSLFRRKTASVHYTRVHTDEEASLLLPQGGHLTDSDDEIIA